MTKSPDEYESAQCGGLYCRPWRPALLRKYASAAASAAGSAGGLRWLCKRPVLAGVPTYWHLYPRPAARKREIAVQTEARHHCTLLVRGPIRPVCPVFEAKAFSRDASARQSRRFPQLSPPPLKINRLGRFAFPGDCYTFRPFAARTPRGMALIQFLKERLVTFAGHGAAASFSERKQDANPARFNARRRIRTAVCCAAAPRLPPSSIPPHRTNRAAARRETELGETARRVGQNTGEGASRSRPGAAATVSRTP